MQLLQNQWTEAVVRRFRDTNLAFIILVSLVSGIGTGSGFIAVTGGWDQPLPTLATVLLLTVIIQTGLVVALHCVMHGGVRTLISVPVWMGLAFLSIAFATAFWGGVLGLDRLSAQNRYRDHAVQVAGEFEAFRRRYERLTGVAVDLSEVSDELAKREEDDGDTCNIQQRGEGPRYRYRLNDRAQFSGFATHFEGQQREMERLYDDVMETVSADALANDTLYRLVHQANSLLDDPRIGEFRTWLYQRGQEQRDGVMRENNNGRPTLVVCELPGLAQAYRTMTELQLEPIRTPDLPDSDRSAASVIDAFQSAGWFFTGDWEKLDKPQMMSLGLGTILDSLLVYLTFFQRLRTGLHSLRPVNEGDQDVANLDGAVFNRPLPKVFVKLRCHSVLRRGIYHVYLTHGEFDSEEDDQLWRLVHSLLYVGLARHLGSVARWRIPAPVLSNLGPVARADHYTIPAPELIRWALHPRRSGGGQYA